MKKSFSKIISSLLAVVLAVYCVPTLALAQQTAVADDGVTTVFNRGFDDGWDYTNGLSCIGAAVHTFALGKEKLPSGKANRYLSITAGEGGVSAGYAELKTPEAAFADTNDFILEFDMRSDGYEGGENNAFLYARFLGDTGSDNVILRKISDGIRFEWGSTKKPLCASMPTEWMHVVLVFTSDATAKTVTLKCYADDVLIGEGTVSKSAELYTEFFRFQVASKGASVAGNNICFDNIKCYTGTSTITELDADDYGMRVDTKKPKTVEIDEEVPEVPEESDEPIEWPTDDPTYTPGADSDVTTIFNRGFDDGWDHTNGLSCIGTAVHTFALGKENLPSGKANRYLSITAGEGGVSAGYAELKTPEAAFAQTNRFILEFDMRSDGYEGGENNALLYLRRLGVSGSDNIILRKNADGGISFEWGSTKQVLTRSMPKDWMHISLVFESDSVAKSITLRCYVDGVFAGIGTVENSESLHPEFFRFQVASKGSNVTGANICFDNIKCYTGTTAITKLDADDYGMRVDTKKPKTVEIEEEKPEEPEEPEVDLDAIKKSKNLEMHLEYLLEFKTEAEWAENFADLYVIVKKIKTMLSEGGYDPTYKNLSELILGFGDVYEYFYTTAQQKHVDYITALLALHDGYDTYMEKIGVCYEIKKYVDNNDVDKNNAQMAALIAQNDANTRIALENEDGYVAERYRDTEAFVSIMGGFATASGYDEILALVNAASEYYYSMVVSATDNITLQAVLDAVDEYKMGSEYIRITEESSAEFKILVGRLSGTDSYAQRYAILARAAALVNLVSDDIDGVVSAKTLYNQAYADYISIISAVNTEILTIAGVASSLSAGYCDSTASGESAD